MRLADGVYVDAEEDETSANIYFYFPLDRQVSLSVSGYWIESEIQESGPDSVNIGIEKASRYGVPISLNLFNQDRLSVHIRQAYYKQKVVEEIDDDFEDSTWVTGISFKYRWLSAKGSTSFGINNLLDKNAEFWGSSREVLAFYPERQWFLNFSLNL